nr:O-antigen ligase family protein [Rhodovibrio sodomensis]
MIGAVLLLLGLISTESRGGFVNLVAVVFLLAVQFRHFFHPRYLGLFVGGVSAAMVLIVVLVPQEYIQRQASLQLLVEWVTGDGRELASDAALDRRAGYIQVAFDAFPRHPVLGTGPDTFKEIWANSRQARWFEMSERPAHNTYLEVLIGNGIVGLAAFLALLLVTYRNYAGAERLLRQHGDETSAHLIGAYKIAFLSVLIYFLVKSGIDHKYFILALPLSVAAQRFAAHRIQHLRAGGDAPRPQVGPA